MSDRVHDYLRTRRGMAKVAARHVGGLSVAVAEGVLAKTARLSGYSAKCLRGYDGRTDISAWRAGAMIAACELLYRSPQDKGRMVVARTFKRHHSTVIHHVKRPSPLAQKRAAQILAFFKQG